ncbi:hypothetical protein D3C86_2059510 [compost metagenome]
MTDLPVEQHQFAVHRQRGALLSIMDAAFEVGQPIAVALGWHAQANRSVAHAFFPSGFFGATFAAFAAILV